MNSYKKTATHPIRIETYAWILAVIWSAIVSASLIWNVYHANQDILNIARTQARVAYKKDSIYRRWNAQHGGVYVPVTKKNLPNPYLDVPGRDISTPSGLTLTLVNPAYMTRQVHEQLEKEYGVRSHITSLNPIRPLNAPDPWETQALEAFEGGAQEVSSVEQMKGKPYMRLMRPFPMEESCFKCHGKQGYKLGDIRGGISVSLPMEPLGAIKRIHILKLSMGHGLLWIVGLMGIVLGTRRLSKQITKRKRAEEALGDSEEMFRTMAATAKDAIIIIDNEGNISYWNPAAEKIFGYTPEEAIGGDLHTFLAPERYHEAYRQGFCAFKDTGKGTAVGKTLELEALRKDGTEFPMEFSLSAVQLKGRWHAVGIVRDISERKKAEKERLRHEKLQGVLEMAGAVCHEMNQPLMAISGYSELIAMDISKDDPLYEKTCNITAQVKRLGNITKKLMRITRYETKGYLEGRIIDIDKAAKVTVQK